MSDRLIEAINALRAASEITSAHDALKTLITLSEDLQLDQPQVTELQAELQETDAKVEELQLALNTAKADFEKFKEEHGFFDRAFGPERRQWSKLRKLIKERAQELAQGQALEISLTLLLDQAAGAEGRPTGLRAAEWRTRIEAATAEGTGALAAVLLELREESKSDARLVGTLQDALDTHGKLMKKAKLRKLVKMMSRGLGGAAEDVDLQEALYNDALITLRTMVEAELASGEQFFLDQTIAAEWLADVTPRLDAMVGTLEKVQATSDAVEVAIPAEEQAKRQVDQSEERLAELKDELDALSRPPGHNRPNRPHRPPRPNIPPGLLNRGVLTPRAHIRAADVLRARVGAPLPGAFAARVGNSPGVTRNLAGLINPAGSGSSSGTSTPSAPAASGSSGGGVTLNAAAANFRPVNVIANSPTIINMRPGLHDIAVGPLRPRPPVGTTPPRPRPPQGTTPPRPRPEADPPPDPNAEKKKRLEAEIATVKEQLTGRRGALARASADLQRKRHELGRAISALDRTIADFHGYLGTWPMPVTMPEAIVPPLPEIDFGDGVGVAGPDGGLLPATVQIAEMGGVEHMVALEELITALMGEARAIGEVVSRELDALTTATENAVEGRMAQLLDGDTQPVGG